MHDLKKLSRGEHGKYSSFKFFGITLEFQESANKLYKEVRENRTRKNNAINCLEDMLVHGRVR